MLKIISFFRLLQLSLLSSYCGECQSNLGRSEYYEIFNIPYQNEPERVQKLLSYPTETQIDIFLFAKGCEEDDRISGIFIDNSNDKILEIARRIQQAKSEKDKMNLIWGLLYIDWKCQCVRNNPEVIQTITSAESKINDKDSSGTRHHKEMYSMALNSIRSQTTK